MIRLASGTLAKRCSFKRSSRRWPFKLLMKTFWVDLPALCGVNGINRNKSLIRKAVFRPASARKLDFYVSWSVHADLSTRGMPPMKSEPINIEQQLARLASMDKGDLSRCWRGLHRKPFPDHLPRHLLVSLLAYQMQVEHSGGLEKHEERYLNALARPGEKARSPYLNSRPHSHTVGTVFVREYGGTLHQVTRTDNGYEWQGNQFRSLSAAARAITGTRWNGPKFFGVCRERGRRASA